MYNLNAQQISNIKILIDQLKNDVTDEQYNHEQFNNEQINPSTVFNMCALGHATRNPLLFPSLNNDVYEGTETFGPIYEDVFHSWAAFGGEEVTRTMVIERLESILKENT